MKGLADLLEKQGRFGDSELVHLNPAEVEMLEKMSPTGKLTTNPTTGKKEAFLPILAAVITAVGTAAYGAKQSRKAQKKAQETAETQALIEGSAPSISNVSEVVAEDVQGTQAVGLEEALAAMDYEAQAAGEEVPVPGEAGQNPMGDISEEELMLLMQSPELMGLGAQETQYAASGGAVGTPEDVYYFGVPQIMGMMQDPNPQIQEVGMQLADQMATMPDAGMVPATANQIQTMAMGGAVTAKKFDNGGVTATEEPYDFFSEEALRPILETEPSFRPEDPSLRQRGERAIAGLLGGDDFGKTDLRQGKKLMQVADMIPGLGDATAVTDVYDDFKAGNNLAGGIGGLAVGIGMIPGLGDMGSKAITTVLQKAKEGGFDILTPYFHGTHAGKNLNMVPEEQRLDNPILSEGFTSMGRPDNSRSFMSNDPRVANTYTLTSVFQDSLDQVQQPVMYPVFINKSNYIRFKHKDPSVDAPQYNKLILDTMVVEKPDGKGGVVTEEAIDYLRKLNPNGDVQKQLDAGFTNLHSSTNGIANIIEEVDKELQPSGIIFEKISDPMSTLRGDLIAEYKNKPEIIAKSQIKDPLHPDSNYFTIDDDARAYADQEISKGSEIVISLDPKTVKGIFGEYEDLESPDLMKAEGGRISSDRLNQLRIR